MTEHDKKLLHLLIQNSQGNIFTGSMIKLMESLGTSKSPEKALKALTHTSVTFKKGDSEAHVVPLLHLVLKKDNNTW